MSIKIRDAVRIGIPDPIILIIMQRMAFRDRGGPPSLSTFHVTEMIRRLGAPPVRSVPLRSCRPKMVPSITGFLACHLGGLLSERHEHTLPRLVSILYARPTVVPIYTYHGLISMTKMCLRKQRNNALLKPIVFPDLSQTPVSRFIAVISLPTLASDRISWPEDSKYCT